MKFISMYIIVFIMNYMIIKRIKSDIKSQFITISKHIVFICNFEILFMK